MVLIKAYHEVQLVKTSNRIAHHACSGLLILLLAAGSLLQKAAAQSNRLQLWYTKPAATWNEALPIGNGHLGAMIYGNTEKETIQLNDNTLYSGEPSGVWKGTRITDTYPYVVNLLRDQKYADATAFVQKNWLGRLHQNYQPLGIWTIVNNIPGKPVQYKRVLDIANAVQRTTYQQNGIGYTRELFATHTDDVIVAKYTSDKKNGLDITVSLSSVHTTTRVTVEGDQIHMSGQAPGYADRRSLTQLEEWGVQYRHPELFYPDGSRKFNKQVLYANEINGTGAFFESRIKVIAPGAILENINGGLRVHHANEVILLFSTATSYNGFNRSPSREGADAAKKADSILKRVAMLSYTDIKNRHLKDYTSLFNRVCFEMPQTSEQELLSTDQRIINYAAKQDNALVALLYQYGRYLMISGSREGGQPLNLQGIWNNKVLPPWNAGYTMNINTEMNYWPAEVTNLSECHTPLFQMIREMVVTGSETARLMYGRKGWVGHHNVSIWRESFPNDGSAHAAFWPMVGAWLCSHLWEHYLFNGNVDFLRNDAYPIMKSATEFFMDWLADNGEGYWVTPVSTSPENEFIAPDGKRASVSMGATMDMALIRELFSRTLEAARTLNVDQEYGVLVSKKLERLLPYRIGARGQLQEWQQDFKEVDEKHRHLSHLYGLYPGNQFSDGTAPDLVKAARKSMLLRGDEATGWSMGWKINLWARLLDGDHANRIIRNLFTPIEFGSVQSKGGGLYMNLFDAHPPFQIDGNFGYTAGVTEMLLQSHAGYIHLLPALPSSWPTGKISGLKARGGFQVTIEWQNGRLLKAEIRSLLGGSIRLRTAEPVAVKGIKTHPAHGANPNNLFTYVSPGKYQDFSKEEVAGSTDQVWHTVDFMTEKGKVYVVEPKN